jgi:hypothetical protein
MRAALPFCLFLAGSFSGYLSLRLSSQELQDVMEADIEALGLKAVAKNRLLRLLSSQKVIRTTGPYGP